MADISIPVYRPTVYPFKFLLAPMASAGINMGFWYFGFVLCAGVKMLNSFILLPLLMIPLSHGVLIWISQTEPHFDTVLTTHFQKNKVNWRLKLLSRHEKGRPIFYPG